MRIFTKVILFLFLTSAVLSANAQSVGGFTSGAATYCSSVNSGFISLTGYTGSILQWESSTDGGLTWTTISNTTPAQSYFNLSQTACYRAIVQSGVFPPDTSTTSCITVFQPSSAGSISGGGTFCGNSGSGTLTLSGNVGNPLYWQYSTDNGVSWVNIPDTTTVLNYPSLFQNTLFNVVVQNGSSCPSDTSSSITFTVDSLSVAGPVSADDTVCYAANSGTISINGNTGTITNWISSVDNGVTWSMIANTSAVQNYLNLTQPTWYAAVVQNSGCPADTSMAVQIGIYTPLIVSAGNDTSIFVGQSTVLNGTGTGIPLWSPATGLSNSSSFITAAAPVNTITYSLTVSDTNGCSSSDDVIITLLMDEFNGMVSNLFTPNGDGINDTWYIENIQNYPGNTVMIYNIYGNKVFEETDYKNDWKGTYNNAELPDGTYYYVLKFDNDQKPLKGSIDILRNK